MQILEMGQSHIKIDYIDFDQYSWYQYF